MTGEAVVTTPAPVMAAGLDAIARRFARRPQVHRLGFGLQCPTGGWRWSHGEVHQPHFIASIAKLYTSAIVMQLRAEGRLHLGDPAARHLPPGTMDGFHLWRGQDLSGHITLRQLLSHTSGLADYFEQRQPGGDSVFRRMTSGGPDLAFGFDEVQRIVRGRLRPRFAPGTPGKAYYADTNYALLGQVIEHVDGRSFAEAVEARIARPLGLGATYVFTPATLHRYDEITPLHHGSRVLDVPQTMASMGPDGGVVSTLADGLAFLRAFMTGGLFPLEARREMERGFRPVFFPLQAGAGLLRTAFPRFMTPMAPIPPMVGHGGASGTVLFYAEEHDLYVAGTVNQTRDRSLPFRLMIQLVSEAVKRRRPRPRRHLR